MNRYLICLMGALLFMTTVSPAVAKEPPPGAAAIVAPNVLIFMDSSGSMARDKNGVATVGDGSFDHPGNDTLADNNDQSNSDNYYNTIDLNYPPNDSRLYIGKHVIWDIMNSSELTSKIRYGLMRFHQDEFAGGDYSSYYDASIHYDGSGNGGDVLVEVGDNKASEIKKWVDGLENYSTDKELRADGRTPLGHVISDIKDYLQGASSPILAECQKTYVILITDGYWNGTDEEKPAGWVDGDPLPAFYPPTMAQNLRNISYDGDTHDVRSFVIGFNINDADLMADLNELATAGGGTDDGSALFATDFQTLKNTLYSVLHQIIAENYTMTSPVINPGVAGEGNVLYTASFIPIKGHQWEGHLRKFNIATGGYLEDRNGDGKISNADAYWDAGHILGNTGGSQSSYLRSIFTVGGGLAAGINNFLDAPSNKSKLEPLLGTTGTDTDDLINFVRGQDSFDENKNGEIDDERWKLSDIYHSIPIEVAKPPYYYIDCDLKYLHFKYNNRNRPRTVYVGGNDGMLHAFNGTSEDTYSGWERWAFIPPDLVGKLKELKSALPNQSNSIYMLDGSPVIEDIYMAPDWKTVLISGEAQGGSAYFAMDITDPLNPEFLWDVENDADISKVNVWDSSGALSVLSYSGPKATHAYAKMGETWSRPTISKYLVKDGELTDTKCTNDEYVYIAAVGAGFSASNDNLGDAVYFMNMLDGSLVKSFDLGERTLPSNSHFNSVVSQVSLIEDDQHTMQYGYVGDTDGRMHKIKFAAYDSKAKLVEDRFKRDPSNWDICTFFDMKRDDTNGSAFFTAPEVAREPNGRTWVLFGSGDLNDIENQTHQNYFVGIQDDMVHTDYSCPADAPYSILSSGIDDVTASNSLMNLTNKGYKVTLDLGEKVVGKPLVYNGVVYFTTYTPNSNPCESGRATLWAMNFKNGSGVFDNSDSDTRNNTNTDHSKKLDLGSGTPTAPVVRGERVYVGLSAGREVDMPDGWEHYGDMVIGNTPTGFVKDSGVAIESWYLVK